MKITETVLTVEMAHELLAINTDNRPVKQDAITRYTKDMVAGRWKRTGESIKVSSTNVLLDGQNRCMALIRANEESDEPIEIPIILIEGLDPDSQDVMDSGKVRSVPDQLTRRGVAQTTRTSATIRLICAFEAKSIRLNMMTNSELLQYFDENREEFEKAVELVDLEQNTSGINKPALVAAAYLLVKATGDESAVEDFMHQLTVGVNLEPGSPILALRTRMQYAKLYRESLNNMLALHTILRMWNAWRKGETIQKLPVRQKGKRTYVDKIEL